MKKQLLFAVLLTVLIVASCLAIGESAEPASSDSGEKQFDVTKAVKLESGVNDVGVVPDGYVLVSFTLYTPEKYTGEERADFRLEGVDPQNEYYYFFEDVLPGEEPITGELTEATDSAEETQENTTFHLVCSTDSINYYIQDDLPDQEIPHKSKEHYTYAEFASDIIEILLNSDMEILLNTTSNLLVGADHRDSELMDLDHNRKLNVIICYTSDDIAQGFVDGHDVLGNLDCFYLNLNALKIYVAPDMEYEEDFLTTSILLTFAHEYTHIVQFAYDLYGYRCDFLMEGFANAMTAIVNLNRNEAFFVADMHTFALFDDFFMKHPKDDQWSYINYTIGGRFWYYVYLTHHLDEPFPYVNTLKTIVALNDIEDISQALAGKDFKDLYREFFLSVFAGNGVDFGPEVTPFSANEEIQMDSASLIQLIYTYYCRNEGFNIYRYEDTPIDVEGLPGCSFVIAEWDQCPKTFIYTPSDEHVETWVFALAE